MSYWSAKSDLAFMESFRADVLDMWARDDANANWQHPNPRYLGHPPDLDDDAEYQEVRTRIAQGMNRAEEIARRHAVGHSISIILRDWGRTPPSRQNVMDGVNRTVGAVAEEVRIERKHVLNPAWWALQVLAFVLRIPLMVAGLMGADREKLEKDVWPRVLSAVLSTVLIAALLAWLGLKQSP